jgi:TatA/E family protein of Tat protein translocase
MDPINLVIVGVIALAVIFGAKKIPEIANSVGRAQGEFKKGLKEGAKLDETQDEASDPPASDAS